MWTPEKNDETCTLLQTKNRTGIKKPRSIHDLLRVWFISHRLGMSCHATTDTPFWFLVSSLCFCFPRTITPACFWCVFFAAAEVSLKAHHTPLTSPFSSMTCVKLVTYVQLGPWSTRRMSPSEYEKNNDKIMAEPKRFFRYPPFWDSPWYRIKSEQITFS